MNSTKSLIVVWEQVWLSWPDERLFRALFGFDAAQGAAALSRLHAIIRSVELPTGATVDVGTNVNRATYAIVRGGSTHVAVAAKAVRAAVEAFVRDNVATEPVNGLTPDEAAFLTVAPPQALAAKIESTFSVVVDFKADDGLTSATGGGSQTPQLLLEATEKRTGAKVRVLHGDLLFSKCGAIVNAANGRLAHGEGVAAAIAAAAGSACDAECRKAVRDAGGVLLTGAAVPTSAGPVMLVARSWWCTRWYLRGTRRTAAKWPSCSCNKPFVRRLLKPKKLMRARWPFPSVAAVSTAGRHLVLHKSS